MEGETLAGKEEEAAAEEEVAAAAEDNDDDDDLDDKDEASDPLRTPLFGPIDDDVPKA